MPTEPSTCPSCGGDGKNESGFCEECMGRGSLPVVGMSGYIKTKLDDMTDKLNDILNKCNDIFEKVNV